MRYFITILFFSAFFWACQPDEACISSATSGVVLDFYVDTLYADTSATGVVTRRDSLFRDSVKFLHVSSTTSPNLFWPTDTFETIKTPRVLLALDPDRDETMFLFKYSASSQPDDTLVLSYERRYRLISTDCPLEVSFRNLQVVHNTFDTVLVINTELLEPNNEADLQIIRPRQQ